ncbi:MAG: hypothetical protein RLZZ444_1142, partial [Pseudomonadota bacterium]
MNDGCRFWRHPALQNNLYLVTKAFRTIRGAFVFGGDRMDKAGANTALSHERLGATLVFLSAVIWSFGGAIARFLTISDSWTIVFWRALFAGLFLLGFLLLRDGT